MNCQLRPYRPEDSPTTVEVFRAAVTGTAASHYSPEQLAAWCPEVIDEDAWAARRAASWTLVAELDGEVVGFADLTGDAVLDMLFVHPSAGGRGVARSLVAAVLAEARRRGHQTVTTHASRSARPVLEHLGFIAEADNPHNLIRGVAVPNTTMRVSPAVVDLGVVDLG